MPFTPFHELFPAVAERETRSVTQLNNPELPDGSYGFLEMFCDEEGCDCRRVFIQALCYEGRLRSHRPLATIAYGWENEAFYREWARFPLTAEDLRELKGPALARLAPQTRHAPQMLEIFESLLDDEAYAQRIVRHYQMFREAIDGGVSSVDPPRKRAPKLAGKIPSGRSSKRRKRRK